MCSESHRFDDGHTIKIEFLDDLCTLRLSSGAGFIEAQLNECDLASLWLMVDRAADYA